MNLFSILAESTVSETGISTEPVDIQEKIEEAGTFFGDLWDYFVAYIPTLISAILIFIVGFILSKLIIALMKKGLNRSFVDKTVTRFIYSVVRIALYVVLATVVLAILGVPMTSIVTVIGTAGVAIGLALQSSLSNVAGGFMILFNKPFRIGDYIMADGVEGTVEVINIWYTQLLTIDNKTVFIPNGQLIDSKITNFTVAKTRRVDMVFSISYNDDFRKAISVLQEVADSHEKVLKDPEPVIRMLSQNESTIDLAFRVWVNSSDYWDVYFDMNEIVKEKFDENGIVIPFKQVDVHIVDNNKE